MTDFLLFLNADAIDIYAITGMYVLDHVFISPAAQHHPVVSHQIILDGDIVFHAAADPDSSTGTNVYGPAVLLALGLKIYHEAYLENFLS